jgi:hypothetical protein
VRLGFGGREGRKRSEKQIIDRSREGKGREREKKRAGLARVQRIRNVRELRERERRRTGLMKPSWKNGSVNRNRSDPYGAEYPSGNSCGLVGRWLTILYTTIITTTTIITPLISESSLIREGGMLTRARERRRTDRPTTSQRQQHSSLSSPRRSCSRRSCARTRSYRGDDLDVK